MTHMQIRRLMLLGRIAQWGFLLGAGIVLVKGVVLQKELPGPVLDTPSQVVAGSSAGRATLSLNELKALWTRDLRQTLIEPKPKEVKKEAPPPPPTPVKLPRLLATFVERGRAYGLFKGEGMERVKGVGDRVGEFQIVAIGPGTAQLQQGGRTHEVSVPRREAQLSQSRRATRG